MQADDADFATSYRDVISTRISHIRNNVNKKALKK